MGTGGRKDRGQGSHQGLYSEVSQAWISILALLLIHRMASGRWINFWVPWSLNDRKYTSPTEVSWDYLFCWACIFLIFCYVSKAMAPHFSTLAWKIPWTEERSRLQSMGSQSQTQLSNWTTTKVNIAKSNQRARFSKVKRLACAGETKRHYLFCKGKLRFFTSMEGKQ